MNSGGTGNAGAPLPEDVLGASWGWSVGGELLPLQRTAPAVLSERVRWPVSGPCATPPPVRCRPFWSLTGHKSDHSQGCLPDPRLSLLHSLPRAHPFPQRLISASFTVRHLVEDWVSRRPPHLLLCRFQLPLMSSELGGILHQNFPVPKGLLSFLLALFSWWAFLLGPGAAGWGGQFEL